MSAGVTGLVVVDKEAGWTSHDVVARCRRIFGQRRVGHAGTLDPDATGVLLVGLGRATRLLRFLTALPKTYTTDIVLGTATSTLDASGEVLATYDMSHVTPAAVAAAAAGLTGEIEQVPPMVSAVKVGGRRLHELAREGVEVDRAARRVTVSRFDTAPDPGRPGVYRAEVVCSSGTYIRVLADDLGRALGGGAHVANLRRTRIGSFGEADMRPLDAIGPDGSSRRPRPCATSMPSRSSRPPPPPSAPGCPSTGCPGRGRRRSLGHARRGGGAARRLRGEPMWPTCAHADRLRRRRHAHRLDAIGPDRADPGSGLARPLRRHGGGRRRRPPAPGCPSTASPWARSATVLGPCSTRRGSCSPSTRRPGAIASGRRSCWPRCCCVRYRTTNCDAAELLLLGLLLLLMR